MKKYKIRCKDKDGYYTETVEGEPIDLMEGYEFFVRVDDVGEWVVTEVSTGYRVSASDFGREEAIEKAKFKLTKYREKFIEQVKVKVEQNKILFNEPL